MFQDGQGQTALHMACQNGHMSVSYMSFYQIATYS